MSLKSFALPLGLIVATIAQQSTQAAPYDWVAPTSTAWDSGWTGAAVPTTSDDLTILGPNNTAGTLAITVGAAAFARTITVTNTSATTINGTAQSLTLQNGLTTGTGAVTSAAGISIAMGASQTWNIGAGNMTVNGAISGEGFSLTKTGAGNLNLSVVNTFSGGLFVNEGVVRSGGGTASTSAFGTGTITLGAAGTANAGISSSNVTTPNAIILGSGNTGTLRIFGNGSSGQSPTFSGTIDLNGHDLTVGNGASTTSGVRLSGQITGSNTIIFDNGGVGITGLTRIGNSNNPSTFTGNVVVSAGAIQLDNSFAAANTFSVASGSTVTLNNNAVTVGGLNNVSGAGGIITTASGTRTLSLAGAGTYTFGGVLQNGSGTLRVIKNGEGTQTLTGANTYTGTTTVTGGTLATSGTGTLGASDVTLTSGVTLTLGNADSFGDGNTLTFDLLSTINMNFTGSDTILSISDGITTLSGTGLTYNANDLNAIFGGNSFVGGAGATFTISAVPESSTWALLLGGIGLVCLLQRRRQMRAQ